jgi:hypothetical protein
MPNKTAVFYFNFSLDNDTERNCGFIFDSSSLAEDYIDEDLYDEVGSDIEDEFGVHDWSSSPAGITAIGYTSYEVTEVDRCMDTWHDKFVELVGDTNVSKWVDFELSDVDDDLSIYNKIKSVV